MDVNSFICRKRFLLYRLFAMKSDTDSIFVFANIRIQNKSESRRKKIFLKKFNNRLVLHEFQNPFPRRGKDILFLRKQRWNK